ncbi:MAG: c-type cytochrome [Phormidesmis sp.]
MLLFLCLGPANAAIAQTEPIQTEPIQTVESLFSLNCAACHAGGGNIIRRGKNLKQKALMRYGYGEVEAIAQLVTQGKGIMPAYADRLSEEEIGAIAQYVLDQAQSGW